MTTSVTLRPVGRNEFDVVSSVEVAFEQIKFSGSVAEAFEADEPGVDFHAILRATEAVGFFKIDTRYRETIPLAGPTDLGLRAFMIDRKLQGQGLATAVVRSLRSYLQAEYPKAPAIMLTVNMSNPAAIACYLKGGFADTGETWLKGIAGPQHVMRMTLRDAC